MTRGYGDMRLEVVGPVFSRVFNPNNAMADRMKHVIEPSVLVQRRTEIPNQDRIPTATGYDIIVGGVTQMTYGLTNRVMVRKDRPGEPQAGAPRELLNVSVRQSYYTDANASKFDPNYSYGYNNRGANPFSPISLVARATPVMPLAIDYRLEYDSEALPDNPKLLGMSLNGTLRTQAVNMTGGWTRQAFATTTSTGIVTNANNFVQSQAELKLKQSRFGGLVTFQYDISKSIAGQPAVCRVLQRAVLRRVVRIPGLQLSQQPQPVPAAQRPAFQHVVHAGGGRVVFELLRGVRRFHVLSQAD